MEERRGIESTSTEAAPAVGPGPAGRPAHTAVRAFGHRDWQPVAQRENFGLALMIFAPRRAPTLAQRLTDNFPGSLLLTFCETGLRLVTQNFTGPSPNVGNVIST